MFKNYDELPIMLTVSDLSKLLGISRAGAYDLVHREDFPTLKIGTRIIIPKDKLIDWIDKNMQKSC
ncbi:MAG: helix-turn-helix domain-containing protein [Clostridia bacterium]